MKRRICIYADEGAGQNSLDNTRAYFNGPQTRTVLAEDIFAGVLDNADMLIMPGGRDKPYHQKLDGAGNAAIHDFVKEGGTYLGICAGAYYGCANIEFQKGTPDEILAPRKIGLLKATAYGCLREISVPFDNTPASAEITTLEAGGKIMPAFYWGGPAFRWNESEQEITIHARYNDVQGAPPAIISRACGKGRVILSGVHFEASPALLRDYQSDQSEDKDRMDSLAEKLENGYDALSAFMKDVIEG